jgi:spore coat polysaccharide biosynthesis predicted glycosyltransferase SpsG
MNALLVCQVGPEIGLGHLMRSLAIFRMLHEAGDFKVHLLVFGSLADIPQLNGIPNVFYGGEFLSHNALDNIPPNFSADLLIFDLHPHNQRKNFDQFFNRLKLNQSWLIAIDSLYGQSPELFDLIFIPSFSLPASLIKCTGINLVYGWDCYLLNVLCSPKSWTRGNSVLALTGGSDAYRLGQEWPSLLNKGVDTELEVDWVVGPYSPEPLLPLNPFNFRVHRSPPNLSALMQSANYGLTVYGVSFFELLYFGVPTVVYFPPGHNNLKEMQIITESRIAVVANSKSEAVQSVFQLAENHEHAETLSRKARQSMESASDHRLVREIRLLVNQ